MRASFQTERLLAYTTLMNKNIVCLVDNSKSHQKLTLQKDNTEIKTLPIKDC